MEISEMRKSLIVVVVLGGLFLASCFIYMGYQFYKIGKITEPISAPIMNGVEFALSEYKKEFQSEPIDFHISYFGKGVPLQPYDYYYVDIYNSDCNMTKDCENRAQKIIDKLKKYDPKYGDVGELHFNYYQRMGLQFLGYNKNVFQKEIFLKPELKDWKLPS